MSICKAELEERQCGHWGRHQLGDSQWRTPGYNSEIHHCKSLSLHVEAKQLNIERRSCLSTGSVNLSMSGPIMKTLKERQGQMKTSLQAKPAGNLYCIGLECVSHNRKLGWWAMGKCTATNRIYTPGGWSNNQPAHYGDNDQGLGPYALLETSALGEVSGEWLG